MPGFDIPALEFRYGGASALRFTAGTFTILAGDSESGAAELLRVIGLLDVPSDGEVLIEGRATAGLAEHERESLRNQRCGYLFAAPFLLPTFTVLENVAMPLFKISNVDPAEARLRTDLLLEFAGLSAEAQSCATELPLFEQHVVSLARALGNKPALLVVESLNAGLSRDVAGRLAAIFRRAAEHFSVAVVAAAPREFPVGDAHRVIRMEGGEVREDLSLEEKPIA